MELIHYMEKFKNKIIVLIVTGRVDIRDIIPDIIILQSLNIKLVLVLGYIKGYEKKKVEEIAEYNSKIIMEISSVMKKHYLSPMPFIGTEIYSKKVKGSEFGEITDFDDKIISFSLQNNKIPIIAPLGIGERGNYYKLDEKDLALEIAYSLNSESIFLLSEIEEIKFEGKTQKFLTLDQIEKILKTDLCDKKLKEVLEFGIRVLERDIREFSILKCEMGNLYKRVLTYDIAGTLISKIDDEKIRPAEIEDVTGIYLLMKNEMERNNILPISDEKIEEDIENYLVFEIDDSIIAAGALKYYGDIAEISKIVTYPRYQGGSKAKKICESLIEKGKKENLKALFGLTVNPAMERLFKSLGFVESPRDILPKKWKDNYDFKRSSKAFIIKISDIDE